MARVPEYLGVGRLAPLWTLPDTFETRLGRFATDYFYTGVFTVNERKIGYLRIPGFSPASATAAIRQLETEIEHLEANTEGLVVDVMRNPGGDACYVESVLARLMPADWQALARVVRPVWDDIAGIQYDLVLASLLGSPKSTKDLLQSWNSDLLKTYQEGAALSSPLSLCSSSGLARTPARIAYTKPAILLVDELSVSAADAFSAQFQDNRRGRLFGWRTNGAGGTVISLPVGFYSETGIARVVRAMQYRPDANPTPEYPAAHFIENVGVRPDIPVRYNTVANFLDGGRPFVDAFLAAIVADIDRKKESDPRP
jgi:C-terminal processing protease CtpA/Prc